jgi:hypothetical protein
MFETVCHTVNIREDGVTLVRGVFRYPVFKKSCLYAELAQACETWLRSSLAPKAVQEYTNDSSPKKRFFFASYEYRFEVTTVFQSKNEISFRLDVTLSRRQSREPLAHYESTEHFRLSDLTLLPPKQKKR